MTDNELFVLHTDLSRISFVSASKFSELEREFHADAEEGQEDKKIDILIEAVSEFHDCTDLELGEYIALEAGKPPTLFGLYWHYVHLINSYVPTKVDKNYQLEWKDKVYVFDEGEVLALFGFGKLTTGVTLTLLEMERVKSIRESKGFENLDFQLGLQQVAILLREPGVKLPLNRRERIEFIDKQVEVFEDLPATIVYDMRFFFLHTLTPYLRGTRKSLMMKHRDQLKSSNVMSKSRRRKLGLRKT